MQRGFAPILIVLLIVVVGIGGYFIYQKQISKSVTTFQSVPSSSTTPSELSGVPLYPGSSFVKQEALQKCSSLSAADVERAKLFLTCDATQYTFSTKDAVDKVVNWYNNDESKSGWKLSGGGGEGSNKYGALSNGVKNYWINIGIDRSTGTEFTSFQIRIPVPTTADGQTVNWKTYTDPKDSITFNYPPDYTLSTDTGILNDPSIKYIFDISNFKTPLAPKEWVMQNRCTTPDSCSALSNDSLLGGSIKFDNYAHYQSYETVLRHGDSIFEISMSSREPNLPIDASTKSTYNKILSTFKFTQ